MKAIEEINDILGIDAVETAEGRLEGRELKAWVYDQDASGRCKTYLNARTCEVLSKAFAELATHLATPSPTGGTE